MSLTSVTVFLSSLRVSPVELPDCCHELWSFAEEELLDSEAEEEFELVAESEDSDSFEEEESVSPSSFVDELLFQLFEDEFPADSF